MSKTAAITAEHRTDPYCDPVKLAALGVHVRRSLDSLPQARRIDVRRADMYLIPGFLKRRDCQEIVKTINARAVPSTLYRGQEREDFRTSYTHHFDRDDPLTYDVEEYISDILGIDSNYSEVMQGQRYQVGQQFKAHHDFFHVGQGYWQHEATRGGQRTWTAMIYLNEPREGGETVFPHLDITLRPETGTLVVWNNMDRDGRPNMKTIHAAMPVKRGIKHLITKWYRQEPWRILNPA